ncbi:MAG: hypothetical protein V3T60_11125 [Candidatus Binatia bacterium]
MAATSRDIEEAYDRGVRELQKILGDSRATDAQIEAAEEAKRELLALRRNWALDKLAEQTRALSALTSQLAKVIAPVEVRPPSESVIRDITAVVSHAEELSQGLRRKSGGAG